METGIYITFRSDENEKGDRLLFTGVIKKVACPLFVPFIASAL
jgi:hypothetical protein